jgi:hypothetical protein
LVPGRTSERGSASLEFLAAGLVLLVPFVYLILALSQLQAGALAVEGAAHQAAQVFVRADSAADAATGATRAIEVALSDYGITSESASVVVSCVPTPSKCLTRRGYVTVAVTVGISLPLLPNFVVSTPQGTVPMHASSTQQVSRFWGTQ